MGGEKASSETPCILMTMQIDAYSFALVKGCGLGVGGWLGREREPPDSLLLGQFSKRSNLTFNTNFNFKQTHESLHSSCKVKTRAVI